MNLLVSWCPSILNFKDDIRPEEFFQILSHEQEYKFLPRSKVLECSSSKVSNTGE